MLKKVLGGHKDASEKALLSSKGQRMVAWTQGAAVEMRAGLIWEAVER